MPLTRFELFQSDRRQEADGREFGDEPQIFRSQSGAALPAGWLGSATRPSDAAELKKLTFVQEWPVADGFWIPWILGKEKGFYADEGIDLEIVAPPTVADTMKFLGTASADVAFTTVMDIIFAKEEGARSRPSAATAAATIGASSPSRASRSPSKASRAKPSASTTTPGPRRS